MAVPVIILFLLVAVISECDAQRVMGNCAVGRECDHCPLNRVKHMTNSGISFKVCCSNCNRYFFSYNVLWTSHCTCMNIPEIDTSWIQRMVNQENSRRRQNRNRNRNRNDNATGLDVSGNCWYGSKCNRCNSNSYINGVEFCCPNCEGSGISVSSINGRHRCTCNQLGYQDVFEVNGNCWHSNNCTNCNSVTYSNGVAFCCQNCHGYPMSVQSINNQHTCNCPQPRDRTSSRSSINGNCLTDYDCDGCSSVSYMNDRVLCCPGCTGSMSSFSDGFTTTCNCH